MIPRRYITEWKKHAPWPNDGQVEQKLEDPDFGGDMYALLRPGIEYDQNAAYELIKTEIIEKI
jgi:hypothetical protein